MEEEEEEEKKDQEAGTRGVDGKDCGGVRLERVSARAREREGEREKG